MRIVEHYYCQAHRDERARELKAQGYHVSKRSSRGSVLSPDALEDLHTCYPYTPSPNGFGGTSASYMARLYTLEA